jgi:hypothetical protein
MINGVLQPAASPPRHRSPLMRLDNVYTSCYSPKLLRARPAPSSDFATQTSPPTHRDNVYASAYASKPLDLASFSPSPQCQVVATQTSPPTHRKLAQLAQSKQPALPPISITATEVTQKPSACARLALAEWTVSADERALRALTVGYMPRTFNAADRVPCLGIGKMSTKSAAAKSHAVHEMDFWMQERSRCKAAALAAMAAGCVLQKPRARRWAVAVAVAHLEEAADDGTDCCEMDGKESGAETVDGEAFVFVGSSIVDAFQNGSAPPGPAERTNPLWWRWCSRALMH